MQFKTIVLEMLNERTELHERPRLTRRLMTMMERGARELKASHEGWMETLCQSQPGSDPSQVSLKVIELALKELEDRLPNDIRQYFNNRNPLKITRSEAPVSAAIAAQSDE